MEVSIRKNFLTTIGVILETFLKMCGVMNIGDKKWKNIFVKLIRAFWILVSIQNYAYLILSRNTLATMVNVIASNQDMSGTQLIKDFMFILRQLGVPFFSFITHITLYVAIGSTMKSFWTALKPINRLLNLHDLPGVRNRSIFASIWIISVVIYSFSNNKAQNLCKKGFI